MAKTLSIGNLSFSHKKDLRPMVNGLTFTIREGDRCAIIGEEGNGKSTLLKIIADPEKAEEYVIWEGNILTGGAVIGYLAQELTEIEKRMSIYEYLAGSDAFLMQTPRELSQIAKRLSFPNDYFYEDRPMGSLSGGEKVKIQLARILCASPDVLLLDEPSGDLDMESLRWLEDFINSCRAPVLYVSHDEMLLEHTANMVIHLELLRRKTLPRATVLRAGYREYVDRRLRAFDHQEQMARDEKARFDAQQERLRQIRDRVNHEMSSLSPRDPHGGKMLKRKMHAITSMGKRFERQQQEMTQMPDTEEAIWMDFFPSSLPAAKKVIDLSLPVLSAPDGRTLAKDLRMNMTGSEKICIVGKNGAGKSTLIRLLAGELLKRNDLCAAYMPQNYPDLLPLDQTPVEFLSNTGDRGDRGDRQEISEIRTFLGSVKFTPEEMSHSISELSGGQKGKLIFLSMIRKKPDVLLLDEPTRNFSPLSGPVIRQILSSFSGGIIAVSHDRLFIREVADRVLLLTEKGLMEVDKENFTR